MRCRYSPASVLAHLNFFVLLSLGFLVLFINTNYIPQIYGLAFDWDPPFISRKLDYVMLREMIDFLGYFPEDWRVELRRLATKCEPARLMRCKWRASPLVTFVTVL